MDRNAISPCVLQCVGVAWRPASAMRVRGVGSAWRAVTASCADRRNAMALLRSVGRMGNTSGRGGVVAHRAGAWRRAGAIGGCGWCGGVKAAWRGVCTRRVGVWCGAGCAACACMAVVAIFFGCRRGTLCDRTVMTRKGWTRRDGHGTRGECASTDIEVRCSGLWRDLWTGPNGPFPQPNSMFQSQPTGDKCYVTCLFPACCSALSSLSFQQAGAHVPAPT